jgi:beta-lactam-binding protein with PASTA domain
MTVPDVVGLPFHVARDLASDAGVTLANPDPDGPPIAALAWPGLFYITSQDPSPGASVERWASVRVEVSAFGTSPRDAVIDPQPSPPSLRAHAEPDGPAESTTRVPSAESQVNPPGAPHGS